MINQPDTLNKVIISGINQLHKYQDKSGIFLGLTSTYGLDGPLTIVHGTPFFSYLSLMALSQFPHDLLLPIIINPLSKTLPKQVSSLGSYNYWLRNSPETKNQPYPDDLDSTFCALAAIFLFQPLKITGEVMAQAVTMLTALETKTGGPYRTWLVPKNVDKIWLDTDIAVNANIGFFLKLTGVDLPNIKKFITINITRNTIQSPYYFGILPVIYFISRYDDDIERLKLINIVINYRNSAEFIINPLNIALVISILFNLNAADKIIYSDLDYLVKQFKINNWQAYPFVVAKNIQGKSVIAGSIGFTIAVCLEAIGKYQAFILQQSELLRQENTQKLASAFHQSVVKNVMDIYKPLLPEVRKQGFKYINDVTVKDSKHNITLLPLYFSISLGDRSKELKPDFLIKLGEINLLGWIAYTIYDNFLDNAGLPVSLSAANIALRSSVNLSANILPSATNYQKIINQILNNIDAANSWETVHCRFNPVNSLNLAKIKLPVWRKYQKLAERSMGHALGPILTLIALGYSVDSHEIKLLIDFFQNYLIAKQLNDDAHDWEDDLKNGQLTPVGSLLIKQYRLKYQNGIMVKSKKLQEQLNEIFWYQTILDVCKIIKLNINKSRLLLAQMKFIKSPDLFNKMLNSLDMAADKALKEQKETIEFFQSYRQGYKHKQKQLVG
jgi:hypothetical protein